MSSTPLAVLVAFAGYSLLNISQATQKIGLGLYQTHRLKGALLWAAATGCTSVSVFIVLYAVSLGSVSVVGAMAGTGLASLVIFSGLVMKERITFREMEIHSEGLRTIEDVCQSAGDAGIGIPHSNHGTNHQQPNEQEGQDI